MADAPTWTQQPPTRPGRYYYRNRGVVAATAECHVEADPPGGLIARFPFGLLPVGGTFGEWLGPVPEPA